MTNCFSNSNNKIWLFWSHDIICDILDNMDQIVNCWLSHITIDTPVYISIVYAKCTSVEREELWNDMRYFATGGTYPWAVCGDFNSITMKEEKKGGKPFNLRKNIPFISCIDDCMLMDVGFNGNNFTWWNNNKKKIWKRLDRLLVNSEWEDIFPISTV